MARVDAAGLEAVQVGRLHLVRRGLEDHLELQVLEEAVRVLAESPVVGPPGGLHVGHLPALRSEHPQERLGVRGARSDLEVERLLDEAPAGGPEARERQDQILKGHGLWPHFSQHAR